MARLRAPTGLPLRQTALLRHLPCSSPLLPLLHPGSSPSAAIRMINTIVSVVIISPMVPNICTTVMLRNIPNKMDFVCFPFSV